VEQRGIEPLTSALRTRRSAKLSYCPTRLRIQFQVSRCNRWSWVVELWSLEIKH
jgi:hypothetical protein